MHCELEQPAQTEDDLAASFRVLVVRDTTTILWLLTSDPSPLLEKA